MKRVNHLYEKIIDPENIVLAYHNARKGKLHYKDVQRIDRDPGKYLTLIYNMLKEHSYKTSAYTVITRNDYGKERIIHKLPFFPDRIVHHAICQVLSPIWQKAYIRDTFACIKGRGIHDGVKRVKQALSNENDTTYSLKLDIKKYYPSIDHDVLLALLKRQIKCVDTLKLLEEIIRSTDGIPIGNYVSQHFANVYLSGFDHYCKEVLKAKFYFRYADDFVILHHDKSVLWEWLGKITAYLATLKLKVKENYQVFPVAARGIDFLGYRFFHTHTLLRKSIKKKMLNKVRLYRKHNDQNGYQKSMASYFGWMKYCNAYNLKQAHGLS